MLSGSSISTFTMGVRGSKTGAEMWKPNESLVRRRRWCGMGIDREPLGKWTTMLSISEKSTLNKTWQIFPKIQSNDRVNYLWANWKVLKNNVWLVLTPPLISFVFQCLSRIDSCTFNKWRAPSNWMMSRCTIPLKKSTKSVIIGSNKHFLLLYNYKLIAQEIRVKGKNFCSCSTE